MKRKANSSRLKEVNLFNRNLSRFKLLKNQIKGEKYFSARDNLKDFDRSFMKQMPKLLSYLDNLRPVQIKTKILLKSQEALSQKLLKTRQKYENLRVVDLDEFKPPIKAASLDLAEIEKLKKCSLLVMKKRQNSAVKRMRKRYSGDLTDSGLDLSGMKSAGSASPVSGLYSEFVLSEQDQIYTENA